MITFIHLLDFPSCVLDNNPSTGVVNPTKAISPSFWCEWKLKKIINNKYTFISFSDSLKCFFLQRYLRINLKRRKDSRSLMYCTLFTLFKIEVLLLATCELEKNFATLFYKIRWKRFSLVKKFLWNLLIREMRFHEEFLLKIFFSYRIAYIKYEPCNSWIDPQIFSIYQPIPIFYNKEVLLEVKTSIWQNTVDQASTKSIPCLDVLISLFWLEK